MMQKTLHEGLPALGLTLSEDVEAKLCAFGRAMVKQNEVMNLTGITEDAAVAKLHLLDSLTVCAAVDLTGKTLIENDLEVAHSLKDSVCSALCSRSYSLHSLCAVCVTLSDVELGNVHTVVVLCVCDCRFE